MEIPSSVIQGLVANASSKKWREGFHVSWEYVQFCNGFCVHVYINELKLHQNAAKRMPVCKIIHYLLFPFSQGEQKVMDGDKRGVKRGIKVCSLQPLGGEEADDPNSKGSVGP